MTRTTRSLYAAFAVALCASLLLGLFSSATQAATISYGNFGPVPPGVSFLDVEESSGTDPVPLYGPPSPFSVGLDFDPTNFVATTANGGADITDGQLNFTIMSGLGITSVSVFEAGDYALVGAGSPATGVLAGTILRATIVEINGAPVAPIALAPSNAAFSDSLPGQVIVGPWSLSTATNIVLPAGQAATKVEVVINNQLAATSEPGTASFIAKKDFRIDVGLVPEPSTLGLVSTLLCGLGIAARRKRG